MPRYWNYNRDEGKNQATPEEARPRTANDYFQDSKGRWHPRAAPGTGHSRNGSLPELVMSDLEVLGTEPPAYRVTVNGVRVRFPSSKDILIWARFREQVFDQAGFVPAKPSNWEQIVNELRQGAEVDSAPPDASYQGQVQLGIRKFLSETPEAEEPADLYRRPLVKNDCFCFRSTALYQWLAEHGHRQLPIRNLWVILRDMGGKDKHIRWKGKLERLWELPVAALEPGDVGHIEELGDEDEEGNAATLG